MITGALTGIGRATASAFAREGTSLVVAGRHEDVRMASANELRALGADVEFMRADVRREEDVRREQRPVRKDRRYGVKCIRPTRNTYQVRSESNG